MTKRLRIDALISLRGLFSGDPVSQLNDYTRRFSEPSFDRWNKTVFLYVYHGTITRPILESMIEFMNLPLAKDPTGTTDEEIKWIGVTIDHCRFDRDCTLQDIHRLFLAIAHRAAKVYINSSSDILSRFLSSCHHDDQLEVPLLLIDQKEEMSTEQFAQLGAVIQRSVHLKELCLYLRCMDGAHEVFAAIANAIELRRLSLQDMWNKQGQRKDLGDLVAGKNGDGPLIRLLRNPHNQLKELTLFDIGMKDHHLIAVLQSLPSKQIEHLNFACNLIQMPGMLELANLLPKMKSLRKVHFGHNPWEDLPTDDRTTIGAALVQGMMKNMSIENIHGTEKTLHSRLLLHYTALNYAGRRVLQLSQPIADGLWLLILARVGRNVRFCVWYSDYSECTRANVIYFFLQNCPRILSFR